MVKKWLDGAMASASITVLAGLAVMAVALPARAGFEWTPPPVTKAPPPVAAVPAPMVESEMLDAPVPMPDEMQTEQPYMQRAEPLPVVQRQQPAPVMRPASPPPPAEAMNVAAPVMAPPPMPAYAPAVGFGNDIPLVLAMRQIVPAEFSYSFDTGVSPGARVSWSGGKPWDETLAEAVRPMGLEVVISGNIVWLRQGWSPSGNEVRVSDVASPMAPAAPSSIPEPLPLAPYATAPMATDQGQQQMPVPLSPAPMPVPMAAAPPPPQPGEQVADTASYPRRQRPEMGDQMTALMAYAQKAPPVPPVSADAAYTNDYSAGPVPLMKALPPPPAPPATAPAGMAPMGSMQPAALDRAATRGPVMDPLEIHFWQAEQGASLKEVLNRWASTADVAILWNSPYDYALPMPMRMHGTFADAVTNLLMGYGMADPRPLGRLHPNLPDGPSVLVIDNYTASTN